MSVVLRYGAACGDIIAAVGACARDLFDLSPFFVSDDENDARLGAHL